MNDKRKLMKHMLYWIGGLFLLFGLIVPIGIYFQAKGVNPNNVLVPIILLIVPAMLFVIGYYGIRHEVSFSREIIGFVILILLVVSGFMIFNSILLAAILGGIGGGVYGWIKNKKPEDSKSRFPRIVGIVSFILGLLSLMGVFFLLIRTAIVFG